MGGWRVGWLAVAGEVWEVVEIQRLRDGDGDGLGEEQARMQAHSQPVFQARSQPVYHGHSP